MKYLLNILVLSFMVLNTTNKILANDAIQFNGIRYVAITGSANSVLSFNNQNFTIGAWIKPDSLTGAINANFQNTIVGCDNWTNGQPINSGYVLRTGKSGKLEFVYALGNGSWVSVATVSAVIVPGVWQYVAVVREGSTIKLFYNNTFVATGSITTSIPSSNATLKIGEHGKELGRTFYGGIDEVKIWSVARTVAEIRYDQKERCTMQSNLLAYYKLNETTGTSIANSVSVV
jgi:hypothetical protein